MSSGKDGWADLIGEQTDPDLGRHEAPTLTEADVPTPLTLPAPPSASTVEAPAPAAPADFSVEDMVGKLQAAPAPAPEGPSFWSEWKEVILTASLGTAVLVGLAVLPGSDRRTQRESTAAEAATEVRKSAPTPPSAQAPAVREQSIRSEPSPAPQPAPAPVVSVVSTPPGAMVQLDGVVYGETPLILPAPSEESALEVVLRMDGYQTYEGLLEAGGAGHFSLNVKLQPRRR